MLLGELVDRHGARCVALEEADGPADGGRVDLERLRPLRGPPEAERCVAARVRESAKFRRVPLADPLA